MPNNSPPSSPDGQAAQSAEWEALARYLTGESPPDEKARLEERLAAKPEDKALVAELGAVMQRMAVESPKDLDAEAALQNVKTRLHRPDEPGLKFDKARRVDQRPIRWQVPVLALAAVAVLTIGIAGYLRLRPDRPAQQVIATSQMTATGVGAIDSVNLPDGTRVILGPLSSITIVKGYGAGRREVELRGDAFFDVVHNASAPFTTRALGVTITDVGTSFAVRTDSSTGVSVTVRDGAVSLKPSDTTKASGVILGVGQYALLAPNGQATTRPATEQDLAWLQRRLVFREAPMSEVTASFRRWYGIELRLAGTSLAKRHLTATFSGETPEAALEVIRLSLGAEIERRGDTAIVRANEGSPGLK
jgi:transmembrane sensor